MIIHVVRPGDNIYKISKEYGIPAEKITDVNRLPNADSLVIGQTIVIPGDLTAHTVTSGQSMYSLARGYGIPLDTLLAVNKQIANPDRLQPGQTVIIPQAPKKLGSIYVNGYAFPNINADVLKNTLPYLTYLSIFSNQVRSDGSLKTINDTELIQAARNAGVAPMMVITNIEEGASFSSELANDILTNVQIQNTLINNIVAILQEKNYYGLDVDFEYLYPEDMQNYNDFISRIVNTLRPLGYTVTVALAPKLSADQKGLLYEAHDYPSIGALADHVILMTYEWGYTYGPAMAVSPINQVRKVLDYASTAMPSEKILMGMPNYGYDWTLPFVRGSAARTLTNNGAILLALKVGANIQYDEVSQSPYFNYFDSAGKRHEVWFDDARSIQARLELVDIYDLGGVSYWTINSFFPINWLILESMYNIRKVI
ncbi:MAG: glycosyl hydrolase family 18 protein [Oscillospiraceae bacterium]